MSEESDRGANPPQQPGSWPPSNSSGQDGAEWSAAPDAAGSGYPPPAPGGQPPGDGYPSASGPGDQQWQSGYPAYPAPGEGASPTGGPPLPPAAGYPGPGGDIPPGAFTPPTYSAQGYSDQGYSNQGYAGQQGYPGQPYPSANYGYTPTPTPGRADVGASLGWSWDVFRRYPLPMLLPGLLSLVVLIVGIGLAIGGLMLSTVTTTENYDGSESSDFDFPASAMLLFFIAVAVIVLAILWLQAAVVAGALRVADGEPVDNMTFLVPKRIGASLVTIVLVGLLTIIGFLLCFLPGLLVIFAMQYSLVYVMDDQKLSPTQAMAASWRLAFANVGDSIIVCLIRAAVNWVGSLIVIGTVVTQPLGEAYLVHNYRALVGRPVAPVRP